MRYAIHRERTWARARRMRNCAVRQYADGNSTWRTRNDLERATLAPPNN